MCFRPTQAKINRCYKCGKVNKPIATVCVDCGVKLELGKTPCPQCETLKDPLAVCPNCGFVPEAECPKCGIKNLVTSEQCANCGYTAPKMPPSPGMSASGTAPKMPPPAGQYGGVVPPKAPPAPPKAPPAPPKVPPASPKKPKE